MFLLYLIEYSVILVLLTSWSLFLASPKPLVAQGRAVETPEIFSTEIVVKCQACVLGKLCKCKRKIYCWICLPFQLECGVQSLELIV